MKEIHVTTMAGLAVEACCRLPEDMVEAMRAARALEPSPVGRNILDQILENAAIAARETMPICQDTGLTVVFAEVGQDVRIVGGGFEDAVNEGVRRGYVDGYLRKSCVAEPLFERKNTRDNTPAVIHTRIVPGDSLRLRLAPKGAGSENKSVLKMLVPADGIEGVRRVVLDAVLAAGFSLSRSKAAAYISAGKVAVNHRDCLKGDRQVAEGDVLTCRGLGKCVVKEVPGQSKKGRTMLVLERYL